jgi:hypothetical protein
MKDTVTQSTFTDAMAQKGYGFSCEGSIALFDHLTEYEEDSEHELEFDPIAFRCEFSEYENLKEIQKSYNDIQDIEDLERNTTVIQIPDSEKIIIRNY